MHRKNPILSIPSLRISTGVSTISSARFATAPSLLVFLRPLGNAFRGLESRPNSLHSAAQLGRFLGHIPLWGWESAPSLIGDGLRKLVARSLAMDLADPNQFAEALAALLKLGTLSVMRALAASAVITWVLGTDCPQFEGQSGLLEKYREVVINHGRSNMWLERAAADRQVDGPLALRNLDLAASVLLVESEGFRKSTRHRKEPCSPIFPDTGATVSGCSRGYRLGLVSHLGSSRGRAARSARTFRDV
jgi:hypothetical protein